MRDFSGKTILITGASRGIGHGLVQYFLDAGARVLAVSRSGCGLPGCTDIRADIADLDAISSALDDAGANVDILINNAGVLLYKDLLDVERDDLLDSFGINVFSTLLLTQMLAKRMIAAGRGGIVVNTLSFSAAIPSVGSGVYAATKSAMASLTRTLAAELAPYGIRVNGYSPGVVETEITRPALEKNHDKMIADIALHRLGTVEQMAEIVAFLCSDEAAYLAGVNLDASGGKFIVQNAGRTME